MLVWKPTGRVPASRLATARVQAHRAVQTLARAARAVLSPRPGDEHTDLGWDDHDGALWTHRLAGGLRLGIRLRDLTLMARAPARADALFNLSGQLPEPANEWARERLLEAGAAVKSFAAPLPYDVPDAGGRRHFAAAGDSLTELAHWFSNGHHYLSRAAEARHGLGLPPGAVRGWPHHFDLAALRRLDSEGDEDDEGGEEARSLSIGLSPGDARHDEPYFYVTPRPSPDAGRLPAPTAGHWHTAGFTSLVLTASELASEDPGRQVEEFLAGSIRSCRALLS